MPTPPRDAADAGPPPPSVAAMVSRFAIAGLLVLVGILLATTRISQDLGQQQALDEARQIARLTGTALVQPMLGAELVEGDPDALAAVDEVMRRTVLSGSLVRVKLWTTDGLIVYSDEGRLIGDQYAFAADRQEAIDSGRVIAEISDLSAPENRYELDVGALLEVYVPLVAADGQPILYEAYFQLDRVRQAGRQAWLAFAPVTLGALGLLQLVQIPLAWSLARRVRSDAVQRELLLRRALDASEVERRRIARDLHDGVVQDLTGVSFALSAAAAGAPADDAPPGPVVGADVVADAASQVRGSIRQLRSLLVDIYPPDLAEEGLGAAIEDLLARHRATGVDARLDVRPGVELSARQAGLVHRIAQEALRNVAKHAQARTVSVVLGPGEDGGTHLRIEDDGAGFDPAAIDRSGAHLGLRVLSDTAAELGARLVLRSEPGAGTEVELWVPGT